MLFFCVYNDAKKSLKHTTALSRMNRLGSSQKAEPYNLVLLVVFAASKISAAGMFLMGFLDLDEIQETTWMTNSYFIFPSSSLAGTPICAYFTKRVGAPKG